MLIKKIKGSGKIVVVLDTKAEVEAVRNVAMFADRRLCDSHEECKAIDELLAGLKEIEK